MPQIKIRNGSSSWVTPKSIKVWNGSSWVQRVGKYWNGSTWVPFISYVVVPKTTLSNTSLAVVGTSSQMSTGKLIGSHMFCMNDSTMNKVNVGTGAQVNTSGSNFRGVGVTPSGRVYTVRYNSSQLSYQISRMDPVTGAFMTGNSYAFWSTTEGPPSNGEETLVRAVSDGLHMYVAFGSGYIGKYTLPENSAFATRVWITQVSGSGVDNLFLRDDRLAYTAGGSVNVINTSTGTKYWSSDQNVGTGSVANRIVMDSSYNVYVCGTGFGGIKKLLANNPNGAIWHVAISENRSALAVDGAGFLYYHASVNGTAQAFRKYDSNGARITLSSTPSTGGSGTYVFMDTDNTNQGTIYRYMSISLDEITQSL